jgi:hypothetical protein
MNGNLITAEIEKKKHQRFSAIYPVFSGFRPLL